MPKLWTTLPGYRRRDFFSDLIAGITVGLVALPMAMAFGIASGVTPQAGIYTAIIGGVLVFFLGGSRVQIGGSPPALLGCFARVLSRNSPSRRVSVSRLRD